MAIIINFKNVLNQGINYNRYYIQALIKYNKPIIVTGRFVGESNSAVTKYTFTNIKPYLSEEEFNIYELTNHINIEKLCVNEYYSEEELKRYSNKQFVIVCKPYYYKDDHGLKRASLDPTDELIMYGFPAIKLLSESKSPNNLPWDKIIDFRTEFDYKFACPKNSKYLRYNKDGVPVKNFTYVQIYDDSIKREASLDDMIRDSIGYSVFDIDSSMPKKTKNFHKKSNIKSVMKASAKRRLYDLKHSYGDSLKNNYSVFQI